MVKNIFFHINSNKKMSQIIHGPPKIWGPGQLPDLPPLKPALLMRDSILFFSKIILL